MLALMSSICNSAASYELTSVAQRIESDTFRSVEIYFTITLLYPGMSWLVMGDFALLSRQFLVYPRDDPPRDDPQPMAPDR